MLILDKIVKDYVTGDTVVRALDNVSLAFRKNEFVSILGHSGCGKTTMLNIIGGLDKYTEGVMSIKGVSTQKYTESDWDAYRNHSIGFVFQSYNLIPHQTVLANVELALTLSGVSKAERRKRAEEVLISVGLGDQLHKKPSQMSGGQMQRVAIARALVNDPEILLADEPTGALDTDTSVQIMDILKEISKDKLIIMVTHNPELAEQYSDRIIRLSDGKVIGDTNPFDQEQATKELSQIYAYEQVENGNEAQESDKGEKKKKAAKKSKPSMSFLTALSLSFNNLLTKKARTFLTSFAGSIGIIGIALILSLSNGINAFITKVQQDTLSSYPITLQKEEIDMSAMLGTFMQQSAPIKDKKEDTVYINPVSYSMLSSMLNPSKNLNNLVAFKDFIEENEEINEYATFIRYGYDVDINAYLTDKNNNYYKADTSTLFESMASEMMGGGAVGGTMSSLLSTDTAMLGEIWEEMMPAEKGSDKLMHDMIKEQYDLVAGKWPEGKNDIMLVISSDNTISDLSLYSLGLATSDEMVKAIVDAMNGITADVNTMESYSYDRFVYSGEGDKEYVGYRIVPTSAYYVEKNGKWVDARTLESTMELNSIISESGIELKITGIIRPNPEATSSSLTGTLVYTSALTDYLIDVMSNSAVVKAQIANPNTDILTGLPFTAPTVVGSAQLFKDYIAAATPAERARIYKEILSIKDENEINAQVQAQLTMLGVGAPPADPAQQQIYKDDLINKIATMANDLGVEENLLRGYLSVMSAEQLYVQITNYIRDAIVQNYDKAVEEAVNNIVNTPDRVELDAEKAKIIVTKLFTSGDQRLGVIYNAIMQGMNPTSDLRTMYTTVVSVLGTYSEGNDFSDMYSVVSALGTDDAFMRAYLSESYLSSTSLGADKVNEIIGALSNTEVKALFDSQVAKDATVNYSSAQALVQSEEKKNEKLSSVFMMSLGGGMWSDDQLKSFYEDNKLVPKSSSSTYEDNLVIMGYTDKEDPSYISIYAKTFEDKEKITALIEKYNNKQTDEKNKISYTDYVGLIMSSVTSIIDAITYVLVFFVSISLVVSSIMIGIITYISVLERTKEIGILRAIGASKRDISRVFNAETLIVGFTAGMIGIIVTVILNIPIALIIKFFSGISGLASLPIVAAIVLVIISMGLTLISGLIPSGIAAKKDPVESLRSE